jgi:hypothetical protein
MDGPAAIGRDERLAPARLDGRQIGHRDRAAERGEMVDDALAERAAIEMVGALGGDLGQRPREVGLAQKLPQRHASAIGQVHGRESRIELGPGLQQRRLLVEFRDAELRQREAVPRQRDRRGEDLGQRLAAIGPGDLAPSREIARHGDRLRAAFEVRALAEALRLKAVLDRRHEIEHAHPALGGDPHRGRAHARKARHEGFDHVERRRRGGCRIEGVAALRQQRCAGLRRERMGGGDHAVQGAHRRSAAMHRICPLLCARAAIRAQIVGAGRGALTPFASAGRVVAAWQGIADPTRPGLASILLGWLGGPLRRG